MTAAGPRPPRTTPTRTAVAALLRKELLLERRVPQVLPAMALFSVVTFVVFRFALDTTSVEGRTASGVLWVTLLFAAMLGAGRLFVADHEEGGIDALLLAPVDRTALLIAKAITFVAFLALVEVVAVPVFVVLLLEPGLSIADVGRLALVLLLADIGIAVIGTLFGALAIQTRARDLILPLMALPLLVPVVIMAAKATAPVLAVTGSGAPGGRYLAVLCLYDLVFGLLAYAVFDFLLDD
ncbi:heme exporter protein CcmB [Paraconexibacter antarcticus]|uniref:Heme exporter protein B n=1 Tax=Paraconexibacter antarcticus TaxID=2949664 RepID=A0ABY5DUY9_9ACTN|nr:heme exporter protein CcmB [Paraconexibacter antarcticus]UTI64512.1 heme exporter protein CcmB [Paraconexibacter antarcticus]